VLYSNGAPLFEVPVMPMFRGETVTVHWSLDAMA
jgi:hypothetical protein